MEEQDVCPGYDDKDETPIGCFVIKNALVIWVCSTNG
jgi:hypothetical protein